MTISRARRTKRSASRPRPDPAPLHPTSGFDADAHRIDPPEIRLDGAIYRGRALSIVEWAPFLDRFNVIVDAQAKEFLERGVLAGASLVTDYELCVDYLRQVLPLRVVELLETQGARLVKEVFARFFSHQSYVHGAGLRTPTAAARDVLNGSSGERPPSGAGPSSPERTTGAAASG